MVCMCMCMCMLLTTYLSIVVVRKDLDFVRHTAYSSTQEIFLAQVGIQNSFSEEKEGHQKPFFVSDNLFFWLTILAFSLIRKDMAFNLCTSREISSSFASHRRVGDLYQRLPLNFWVKLWAESMTFVAVWRRRL